MGGFFSNAIEHIQYKYFASKKLNLIVTGLEGAGKTTFFYKIKLPLPLTIPNIGFNIETTEMKNISITVYDVGGANKREINRQRTYLMLFPQNISALIWMVDSTDRERIALNPDEINDENKTSAKQELHHILNDNKLKNAALLIFSSKIDHPTSMPLEEVLQKINVSDIKQKWFAIETCVTTGDNLYEGLDWLSFILKKNRKPGYCLDVLGNECVSWFSKEKHHTIFENKKKTILLISGYMRNIDQKYKLHTPSGLTKLSHQYYQDPQIPVEPNYEYYG